MHQVLRWIALAVLSISSLGAVTAAVQAQDATETEGYLVVADPIAEMVFVLNSSSHELVAEFEGIAMNSHAGYLPLPDGRLLLVDLNASELLALDLSGPEGPRIESRVLVPAIVSHIAIDPSGRYAAVGASDERQPLTLVDLESFTSRSFDVEAGEVGLMLGGDPLSLFHRNDVLMQVEAYPVEELQRGNVTPTGVIATGAFGHGEVINHDLGRLYLATADGVDVVQVDGTRLTYHNTLPWDAAGREGGRAFFMRLGPDGQHVISYIANRGTGETPWEEWTNDIYIIDTATDEVIRHELAPGLVYRFGAADDVALFFNMHPDGDFAHIVDLDPSSQTFGQVTASIELDPLSKLVGPGESPWGAESRIATISPDGSMGYVTAGGDGYINVIDIETAEVVDRIDVPTELSGGGYLIVFEPGMAATDTVGR